METVAASTLTFAASLSHIILPHTPAVAEQDLLPKSAKNEKVVLTSLDKIQDPVLKVSTLHTDIPPPSPARLLQGDRPEQHPRPHRDRRRSRQERGVLVNTLRAAAAVPCQALTVGDSKAGIPVTRSSEAETLAIGNSRG